MEEIVVTRCYVCGRIKRCRVYYTPIRHLFYPICDKCREKRRGLVRDRYDIEV